MESDTSRQIREWCVDMFQSMVRREARRKHLMATDPDFKVTQDKLTLASERAFDAWLATQGDQSAYVDSPDSDATYAAWVHASMLDRGLVDRWGQS